MSALHGLVDGSLALSLIVEEPILAFIGVADRFRPMGVLSYLVYFVDGKDHALVPILSANGYSSLAPPAPQSLSSHAAGRRDVTSG